MDPKIRIFDPVKERPADYHGAAAVSARAQLRRAEPTPDEPPDPDGAPPRDACDEDTDRPPTVLELLDARRVSLADPPPKPVPVFSLAGQCISTSGNLTVLSGQSKTGKSAVVAAMLAAPFAVPGSDLLGFGAAPAHGKAVIVFDTEQSPYDAWRLQYRALQRAGLPSQPPNLRHFYLLDMTPAQRQKALGEECERGAKECGGIHTVLIDGIADLLDDPSDGATSFALVTTVISIAVRYGCPVVAVLHENPAYEGQGGKTRGHLGSQCERKAESNLRMVKDAEGITTIFTERSRSAHIAQSEGVCFRWDDELQRHVTTESAQEAKAEAKREEQAGEVEAIFGGPEAVGGMTWSAIIQTIQNAFGLSKDGARKRLVKLTAANLVRKNSAELYVKNHR